MERLILSFPDCIRTSLGRLALVSTLKEGAPLALNIEQHGPADDADMYRLLSAVAGQRRVIHATFHGMTFTGFYAQMLLAFMSRHVAMDVVFYACAFSDYVEYKTDCAHPALSVELNLCKMNSASCDDFIASMARLAFSYTKVTRCLGAYLISGRTVQKK